MAQQRRLKDAVRTRLRVVAVAYAAAVTFLALGMPHDAATLGAIRFPTWLTAVLPTLALTLVAWLDRIGPADLKKRLVFGRTKDHEPGHRAFDDAFLKADPRIDVEKLREKVGGAFPSPGKQNAVWYKLYKQHDTDAAVDTAQFDYLQFRELTWFFAVSAVVVGVLMVVLGSRSLAVVLGVTALAAFACARASRNSAERFVHTVLALHAATDKPSVKGT